MCKHVKKSTCREVQGRQLRFHVQNSSSSVFRGLYNVITHEHVTISGIKKACKALTVWRGGGSEKTCVQFLFLFIQNNSSNTQKAIKQSRMFQNAFQTWMREWKTSFHWSVTRYTLVPEIHVSWIFFFSRSWEHVRVSVALRLVFSPLCGSLAALLCGEMSRKTSGSRVQRVLIITRKSFWQQLKKKHFKHV